MEVSPKVSTWVRLRTPASFLDVLVAVDEEDGHAVRAGEFDDAGADVGEVRVGVRGLGLHHDGDAEGFGAAGDGEGGVDPVEVRRPCGLELGQA
ncbi:hypothetical protein AB0O34_35895 [Sphaerisporangium sp. NPDC088356]|uniref:hypothetical protein n=1 Tax=Sphaerisporangium sp. NPDC088356 TaxID=3154871 RepID=UPI00343E84DE